MPRPAQIKRLRKFSRIAMLFFGAGSACSCSTFDAYRKCGWSGCPGDMEITHAVQAKINTHPALRPPDDIRVQTLDHVVYLTGSVDTDPEKDLAESAAREVPGVTRVVSSIVVHNHVY